MDFFKGVLKFWDFQGLENKFFNFKGFQEPAWTLRDMSAVYIAVTPFAIFWTMNLQTATPIASLTMNISGIAKLDNLKQNL